MEASRATRASLSSDWILLATDRSDARSAADPRSHHALPPFAGGRTWTDDYSNVPQVMTFGRSN
jgi:hypothetical protein